MQKITPTTSSNITLQPKVHTTTPNLLHPAYRANQPLSPAILPLSPQPIRQHLPTATQQWTPFMPYYQQNDTDTGSTASENSDEDFVEDANTTTSSEDSYHSPPHSPNPLQRHLQWLDDQRRRAQQALVDDDNAIVAFRPPPPPPPPPTSGGKNSSSPGHPATRGEV